jgi:YD repeat-containing protein
VAQGRRTLWRCERARIDCDRIRAEVPPASITIGHTAFDRVEYDGDADVLYLHVGDPNTASAFEESPEGHALRYDSRGQLVGVTIVNAKRLLDEREPIVITIPERVTVDPSVLASALQSAA